MRSLLLASCLVCYVAAFAPSCRRSHRFCSGSAGRLDQPLHSGSADVEETVAVDPKEAVKIFGRLAEKYIALDSSGGSCCYSACTDCEYRLPGGGYVMADQSAARPKWIPNYETRNSNNREHITKWSSQIFAQGPAVTKEEFVELIGALDYVPPLGGPYVGASAAKIEDATAVHRLFDALSDGKAKLTKHKMSVRLKELADGEEGMTWQSFERVMGLL